MTCWSCESGRAGMSRLASFPFTMILAFPSVPDLSSTLLMPAAAAASSRYLNPFAVADHFGFGGNSAESLSAGVPAVSS